MHLHYCLLSAEWEKTLDASITLYNLVMEPKLSNGAKFHIEFDSLLSTKLFSVVMTLGRTFFLTEITVIPDF